MPDDIDFFYVGGTRARAVFNQAALDAASPFSYASVPFSTATDRDAVIVAIAYDSTAVSFVTGCTIGGSAASLIASIADVGDRVEFYIAQPAGTSGTVGFSQTGSPSFSALGCWSAYGLKSLSPIDTQTGMGAQSITAHTRGFVLAAAKTFQIPSVTWAFSGITQDGADQNVGAGGGVVSRVFARNSSPGASLSYSITNTAPDSRCLAISMR